MKNTDKYTNCKGCDKFEHYHCAKVGDIEKQSLLKKEIDYFCTNCVARDPNLALTYQKNALKIEKLM